MIFDLSAWTWVRFSGRDAHQFLHNFCTNDILKLPHTHGCEAFVTNVKARVLGHIFAFDTTDDSSSPQIDVFSSPRQEQALLTHLDRYIIREDVTLTGLSDQRATTFVMGDSSSQLLDSVLQKSVSELHSFQSMTASPEGHEVRCYRLDLLGSPGFLLTHQAVDSEAVRTILKEAGGTIGSPDDFELRRMTAVLPLYGIDVSEEQLAPEVDRPWAINYTKGCYLGQEPIARIDALGHVNRLLRGINLDADQVLDRGTRVFADDKEIGVVTSSIHGKVLAMLRTKFASEGTMVTLGDVDRQTSGQVFAAPHPAI